jgi:hypothetical protein
LVMLAAVLALIILFAIIYSLSRERGTTPTIPGRQILT